MGETDVMGDPAGDEGGVRGEAAIDDALAALARAIRVLDDAEGAEPPATSPPQPPHPRPDSSPHPPHPRPGTRLVEVTLAVSGPGALASALAELRARPEVFDARVRRLEPGHAVVATLVSG